MSHQRHAADTCSAIPGFCHACLPPARVHERPSSALCGIFWRDLLSGDVYLSQLTRFGVAALLFRAVCGDIRTNTLAHLYAVTLLRATSPSTLSPCLYWTDVLFCGSAGAFRPLIACRTASAPACRAGAALPRTVLPLFRWFVCLLCKQRFINSVAAAAGGLTLFCYYAWRSSRLLHQALRPFRDRT